MIKYSHIKDSCSNFSGSRKINILAVGARKKNTHLGCGRKLGNRISTPYTAFYLVFTGAKTSTMICSTELGTEYFINATSLRTDLYISTCIS